ncbi:hypothetical protein TNCT_644891 [Trichonephila clavata]|uniref:Uncharacterized protein n=1 Tax=Trichonephila clavata TaxID=2740835 RepID=A0A8X6L7U2_TRICU|nr:hypothetical protein TNCT_644891 [Trichonephila clavata]
MALLVLLEGNSFFAHVAVPLKLRSVCVEYCFLLGRRNLFSNTRWKIIYQRSISTFPLEPELQIFSNRWQ